MSFNSDLYNVSSFLIINSIVCSGPQYVSTGLKYEIGGHGGHGFGHGLGHGIGHGFY
jgi:hypothetical protein